MFKTIAAAVLTFAATQGLADPWEESIQRGLESYYAEADGGSVMLVCDADRVYNPERSYASFFVRMPRDPSADLIVFLSSSGEQASFSVLDGISTQVSSDPNEWSALVSMVQRGGQIAVVTAYDSFRLDMDAIANIRCS